MVCLNKPKRYVCVQIAQHTLSYYTGDPGAQSSSLVFPSADALPGTVYTACGTEVSRSELGRRVSRSSHPPGPPATPQPYGVAAPLPGGMRCAALSWCRSPHLGSPGCLGQSSEESPFRGNKESNRCRQEGIEFHAPT